MTHDDHVTGQDSKLKFKFDGKFIEIPVTNVSWSRDTQTSTVRHNDSLNPTRTITGVDYSGSFEYTGRNYDAMNKLVHGKDVVDGDRVTAQANEPVRATLMVKEFDVEGDGNISEYSYKFRRCIITSTSRDLPASDNATTSFDWEAEDLKIQENGNSPTFYDTTTTTE
jgi:hypothetical protein